MRWLVGVVMVVGRLGWLGKPFVWAVGAVGVGGEGMWLVGAMVGGVRLGW